jgi:hypothetical protein
LPKVSSFYSLFPQRWDKVRGGRKKLLAIAIVMSKVVENREVAVPLL